MGNEKLEEENMNRVRESNYDLLRIISTIMVISIHVSGLYIFALTSKNSFGDFYSKNIEITCLYNVLPRFAVPCFVMISGAFIISDDRNGNCQFFYGKSVKNIGVQIIVFSILYTIYSLVIDNNTGGYKQADCPNREMA